MPELQPERHRLSKWGVYARKWPGMGFAGIHQLFDLVQLLVLNDLTNTHR